MSPGARMSAFWSGFSSRTWPSTPRFGWSFSLGCFLFSQSPLVIFSTLTIFLSSLCCSWVHSRVYVLLKSWIPGRRRSRSCSAFLSLLLQSLRPQGLQTGIDSLLCIYSSWSTSSPWIADLFMWCWIFSKRLMRLFSLSSPSGSRPPDVLTLLDLWGCSAISSSNANRAVISGSGCGLEPSTSEVSTAATLLSPCLDLPPLSFPFPLLLFQVFWYHWLEFQPLPLGFWFQDPLPLSFPPLPLPFLPLPFPLLQLSLPFPLESFPLPFDLAKESTSIGAEPVLASFLV